MGCRFDPWVGKIPWRRARQHTPVHGVAKNRTQLKRHGTHTHVIFFLRLQESVKWVPAVPGQMGRVWVGELRGELGRAEAGSAGMRPIRPRGGRPGSETPIHMPQSQGPSQVSPRPGCAHRLGHPLCQRRKQPPRMGGRVGVQAGRAGQAAAGGSGPASRPWRGGSRRPFHAAAPVESLRPQWSPGEEEPPPTPAPPGAQPEPA